MLITFSQSIINANYGIWKMAAKIVKRALVLSVFFLNYQPVPVLIRRTARVVASFFAYFATQMKRFAS